MLLISKCDNGFPERSKVSKDIIPLYCTEFSPIKKKIIGSIKMRFEGLQTESQMKVSKYQRYSNGPCTVIFYVTAEKGQSRRL